MNCGSFLTNPNPTLPNDDKITIYETILSVIPKNVLIKP